ncbi:MAG: DNA translocase FtsK [Lentisphaeraceae bacterium]|nr:DNA translocase FtsK [Lentisphaeraceae bacterium]
MSENGKSFFNSPEWEAFKKPFIQLLSFFKKSDQDSTDLSTKAESSKLKPAVTPVKSKMRESRAAQPTQNSTSESLQENVIEEVKPSPEELKKIAEEERLRKEEEEKQRDNFLLSKFEQRKLEREKRRQELEELEATIIEEERVPIAEKQDFPQYSLEDFMGAEDDEKEETPVREFNLPQGGFQLPKLDSLFEVPEKRPTDIEELKRKTDLIQDTLDSFRIDATVAGTVQGPRITRFEIRPAQGVNVDTIVNINKNMAMELEAESLRVLAPIPGKPFVGIEVPNDHPEKVAIRELLENENWRSEEHAIPLALGKNTSGEIRVLDLAKAPHLLIAGATGAGKSVCINTIVMSMIYRLSPEELQLILVDPKVVELTAYQELPHLIAPVITDTKKVPVMLKWVVAEMKRRYKILASVGARNIAAFNSRPESPAKEFDEDGEEIPKKFPFMVVIIDELADIMMTAGADVETALAQIAQLSRAVGIHTIIATQRPSVNVITGIIKANYPTRIAFQVSSHVDSRTIIDGKGAEQLLGRGDMLYSPPGASIIERLQGAMVEDPEIDDCIAFLAEQMDTSFEPALDRILSGNYDDDGPSLPGLTTSVNSEDEALIKEAMEIIARDRKASTSYLQRRLRIGYNRAATLIEKLEEMGVVGPQVGSAPREIFID